MAMGDYVVAIDNVTDDILNVWEGDKYRTYDAARVTQYRISRVRNMVAAIRQARAVQKQIADLKAVREVGLPTT